MIETFLRAPRGAGQFGADGVRVLGLVSMVAAGIGWGGLQFAVFALILPGLLVPRFLGIRPGLDITFGLALLVAGWSSVFNLYSRIGWWDVLVHFVTNGLAAAVIYILAVHTRVVPGVLGARAPVAAPAILTTVFGLAGGVLWEMAEWTGHTFVDSSIFVDYNDTIGDLAAGGCGALLAGCLMPLLAAHNRSLRER